MAAEHEMREKRTDMSELNFKAIGVERLRVFCDGEGITTLVAGYGCPLRCRYCLNPQCFERKAPVKIYGMQELIEEVAVDDLYFQATGGGVVFGGGEPLLQADFIHEFRRQCPPEWKVYLESSLAVPEKEFEKVISDIDFFLIDIKDMDSKIYEKYTGINNGRTLQNLKLLVERGLADKAMIRIPLIPDFNTKEQQQKSIATLRDLGFTEYDVFTYSVDVALSKRKQ